MDAFNQAWTFLKNEDAAFQLQELEKEHRELFTRMQMMGGHPNDMGRLEELNKLITLLRAQLAEPSSPDFENEFVEDNL